MDKWTGLARGLSWWILGLMSTSQRTCVWSHHKRELYFYFRFICVKTMCFNYRDVQTMWWYFYFICQLMCDWSLGAHKVMHYILSLKIGVTTSNNKEAKFQALFFVHLFFSLSSSNYRIMESFFYPDLHITSVFIRVRAL
jgi:hypothetical protein